MFACILVGGSLIGAPPVWDKVPELKSFAERFGGASPYVALSKNWPTELRPSEAALKAILGGQSKITLSPSLHDGDREVSEIELSNTLSAIRFEKSDQWDLTEREPDIDAKRVLAEEERFRRMVENMQQALLEKKSDELLVYFVGLTHALDFYFAFFMAPDRGPRSKIRDFKDSVLYVTHPVNMETRFSTPDAENFSKLRDGVPNPVETIKRASYSLAANTLGRIYYYQNLSRGRLKLSDFQNSTPKNLSAIVIGDLHDIRTTDLMDQLPSPNALRAAGFKSIRIGLEAWKYGEAYKIQNIGRAYLSTEMANLTPDELEALKANSPKAYDLLQKPFHTQVALPAFEKWLRRAEAAGSSVSLTGLEDFDRIAEADKKTAERTEFQNRLKEKEREAAQEEQKRIREESKKPQSAEEN